MSPREADSPALTITSVGDAAVILRWGGRARVEPLRIAAVDRSIRAARLRGVVDVVPAPASVLVRFDPVRVSVADLETRLRRLASARVARARARGHRLAVRYGGEDGPDLEEVAERLRLRPGQVVARHQAVIYTVLATGFAPGFVYLGPLPRSLRLPRRAEPRVAVPAGSVAIADAQTGVYGARTGGGWWLIGRTESPIFRPEQRSPAAFAIGDSVTFAAAG